MKPNDTFSGFHPILNFLYFGLVLLFSMCFFHPVCLGISFLSALAYSLLLRGRKTVRFTLTAVLPLTLFAALVNLAFHHEGLTILAYLPSGNPLTLESILYGFAAAGMLAAVLLWFSCWNEVITSEKLLYLFGRILPALSLVLSMTLRFVPRLTAQVKTVSRGQRCLGRDVSQGTLFQRAKLAVRILSIVVTWSLENAIETADSMRSRGYGLKGRTAFHLYRFDRRDGWALLWLALWGGAVFFGWGSGRLSFHYYPTIAGISLSALPFLLAYLALCLTPVILNAKEAFQWRHL